MEAVVILMSVSLFPPVGRAQVAFSASLISTEEWTHQGPWMQDNRLVFRKVTTNVGGAYDPNTGTTTHL